VVRKVYGTNSQWYEKSRHTHTHARTHARTPIFEVENQRRFSTPKIGVGNRRRFSTPCVFSLRGGGVCLSAFVAGPSVHAETCAPRIYRVYTSNHTHTHTHTHMTTATPLIVIRLARVLQRAQLDIIGIQSTPINAVAARRASPFNVFSSTKYRQRRQRLAGRPGRMTTSRPCECNY